ncbi:Xylose isomerase (EC [Olavius sp. associated proteobacterium Delta 1]|nr:Xylose isomerase (EC [Olavius sp. associated proteobacterium Delta 1]
MNEFFPNIQQTIPFEGPDSKNPLAFKYYNSQQVIGQKTMKEHLRFSVAYWHTFKASGMDPFGAPTFVRPWINAATPLEQAEYTVRAAFEFAQKLGAPFYCFHDRDLAPEGDTFAESCKNLEAMVATAKQLQEETGIKLLWGTANLFGHPRYAHGAASNPDAHVFAYAAAQVKHAIAATNELGGVNYVFWGGREGYETLLNTDMKREQEQMARFFHMALEYARQIGFDGQFLIEPKPKEPAKHQYDFDAATVLGFLRAYDLYDTFKLNIEANHATLAGHTFEHDLTVASIDGKLGSIDANVGDPLLGWDTDQFPTDPAMCTLAMLVVLKQGGIGKGGFNFDAKPRRGSFDEIDLFYAHISGMDTFARGLLAAHQIIEDEVLDEFIKERYASYTDGIGKQIMSGQETFESLEQYLLQQGDPAFKSGRQEMLESILHSYV